MRCSTMATIGLAVAMIATSTACVRRTIAITSTPSEALVFVNDREVGRTPCEVEFQFYGEYDVRLRHDGYEPVIGSGMASAPLWDFIGADLVCEMIPAQLESKVSWHFDMIPADHDHARLFARALDLRKSVLDTPASQADAATAVAPVVEGADGVDDATGEGALPAAGPATVPVPPTENPAQVPGEPGKVP